MVYEFLNLLCFYYRSCWEVKNTGRGTYTEDGNFDWFVVFKCCNSHTLINLFTVLLQQISANQQDFDPKDKTTHTVFQAEMEAEPQVSRQVSKLLLHGTMLLLYIKYFVFQPFYLINRPSSLS